MKVIVPPRNRSFGALDALGVVGLVGLLIARFVPVAKLIPFWGCSFRKLTGYPCPGCGLTRAADRFAHFHWLRALEANPLGTAAALFFATCVVLSLLHLVFGMPVPELVLDERESRRARWAFGVLVVANYAFVVVGHRVLGFT